MAKKILIPLLSLSMLFAFGVSVASAQISGDRPSPISGDGPSAGSFSLKNPFSCGDNCTLVTLLELIVDRIVLPIGGVLAVLAFIYSGFLYVMAQGKPAALEKANRALLYTAIGTAVLLGSWAIANVIQGTINQLK